MTPKPSTTLHSWWVGCDRETFSARLKSRQRRDRERELQIRSWLRRHQAQRCPTARAIVSGRVVFMTTADPDSNHDDATSF